MIRLATMVLLSANITSIYMKIIKPVDKTASGNTLFLKNISNLKVTEKNEKNFLSCTGLLNCTKILPKQDL